MTIEQDFETVRNDAYDMNCACTDGTLEPGVECSTHAALARIRAELAERAVALRYMDDGLDVVRRDRDGLRADNERLREALEHIADHDEAGSHIAPGPIARYEKAASEARTAENRATAQLTETRDQLEKAEATNIDKLIEAKIPHMHPPDVVGWCRCWLHQESPSTGESPTSPKEANDG